jgi:hypothetical protein
VVAVVSMRITRTALVLVVVTRTPQGITLPSLGVRGPQLQGEKTGRSTVAQLLLGTTTGCRQQLQ